MKNILYFCEIMETGQLAQTAINILEWSGDIMDTIWNPFEAESFWEGIFQNDVRFWSAIVIFLIWLSVLIRVIKDSNARSSSFRFQLLAVFLVVAFTPIFGLMLYIAIRPQWWKWDKIPRRDNIFQKTQVCENCGELNLIQNLYCTSCWENLHITCRECQTKYSRNYSYCPNCGAPRLEG